MKLAVVVLVAPGGDPAPALAALTAEGFPAAAVVRLVAPGAWAAARNAALGACGDADVLAFVDHDVRVDPGWGEALRGVWVGGFDKRIGAVGGPVRAVGAPAWLTGDHAEVLGLHGTGPGPFPGGNVAFRVAALRGVGGFFPARGHGAVRDTVGEDRRAQRELEAVGWTLAAVPGLGAVRELSGLTPGALLRRRLHAGARTAALGGGGAGADGRALVVRAGAAAAVRGLRGDRAGAINRAAWAAHGAGALVGRPLAHAGLQPDRTATALRPDVAPAARHPWAPRRLRRAGADGRGRVHGAILLYHRVVELDADPLALAVTPAHFAEQLAVLGERWTVAPLEAVVDGTAGPHAVAVTFDDGYHDNLLHALPALAAADVPATLFASTGHVATGERYWWDGVTAALATPGGASGEPLTLVLPGGPRAWAPRTAAQRAAVRTAVHAALRTLDHATIAAALAELGVDGAPPERDRPLTVDELRTLAAAGPFAVQAHGRTHLSLAHAPAAARAVELAGSAEDLEGWLGARPTVFSYPFGVPSVDVDGATRAAARAAGYACATVNAPGRVRAGTDPYALPRLAVPDVDGPTFGRWLAALHPGQ